MDLWLVKLYGSWKLATEWYGLGRKTMAGMLTIDEENTNKPTTLLLLLNDCFGAKSVAFHVIPRRQPIVGHFPPTLTRIGREDH